MIISRAFFCARKRSHSLRCRAGDMLTVGMLCGDDCSPSPLCVPCRAVAMGLTTATREGVCIILGADGTAVGRCMGWAGCALHDEQHVAYDVDVAPSSTFHSGDNALLAISPPGTAPGVRPLAARKATAGALTSPRLRTFRLSPCPLSLFALAVALRSGSSGVIGTRSRT